MLIFGGERKNPTLLMVDMFQVGIKQQICEFLYWGIEYPLSHKLKPVHMYPDISLNPIMASFSLQIGFRPHVSGESCIENQLGKRIKSTCLLAFWGKTNKQINFYFMSKREQILLFNFS